MATHKKAQGLPISTIVLIVISLLVLFVIIAFFAGAFGKVGSNVKTASGSSVDSQIATAQAKCAQWCQQAASVTDAIGQQNTAYCKKAQWIDKNSNGAVEDTGADESGVVTACKNKEGDGDELLCCWQDPILVQCAIPKCW